MAEHLNGKNFKDVIENLDVAIVDFWAEWCAPCKAISPLLDAVEAKMEGKFKLFKLNVDTSPLIASEYGVESIPTILVFKNGKPVSSLVGLASRNDIEKTILSVLK